MRLKIPKSKKICIKKRNHRNHSLYDYHLAIKRSENDAKSGRHLGNWDTIEKDGWHFSGTKEPWHDCGEWVYIGCTNVEEHERRGFGRKTFLKKYKKTSKCADCKGCVDDWIIRNADRAAKRILRYTKKTRLPAFHLALSPSKENQTKSETELRNEVEVILKEINCKGGGLVFHPFSQKPKSVDWRYFPHFHFVGFGWMRLVKVVAKKYGWVVIYLKRRKYLFGTFCYLFSHCGIKKGRHAITWLGDLSYGKLTIYKRPNIGKCPACGRKLVPIYYDGIHPVVPPDEMFEGFVDSADWYEVKTMEKSEWTKQDRQEFVLEKELYVANKGVILN